jgi:hypothetical protein
MLADFFVLNMFLQKGDLSFMSQPRSGSLPYSILALYAPEDEALYRLLEQHLIPLRRQRLITLWSVSHVVPGRDVQKEIDAHLNTASIILLLISKSFLGNPVPLPSDSTYTSGSLFFVVDGSPSSRTPMTQATFRDLTVWSFA